MMIGVLGRDAEGWGTLQLISSLKKRGISPAFISPLKAVARIAYKPALLIDEVDVLKDLAALIVRPIGRGSLEEIIFRMDTMLSLERRGTIVINPTKAIERCVDKYYALALLEENGLPVPRTLVTEKAREAMKGFNELGGDVVLKPLFGSRGIGSTRISNVDVAARIFSTIEFNHGVLYLQEFLPHGDSDIRAFVIGDRVIAAMQRVGESWKTNVSQGARPVAINLTEDLEALALRAAKAAGCKIAGVDILEHEGRYLVIELNSQPGWRGLQSVTEAKIADCIVDFVLSEVKS
jgi:RimK family alpha-L-glutamate ligase